jgi:hypothetical protein
MGVTEMNLSGPTNLVSSGELPWTPEDIRAHLRLLDPSFDSLIKTVIASQCFNAGCSLHGEVWAVCRGDDLGDFYARLRRIGRLSKIGPAYQVGKHTYHDCEFGPVPEKARKAFRAIINWCHQDEGIYRAMRREDRGEFRPVWPAASSLSAHSIAAE